MDGLQARCADFIPNMLRPEPPTDIPCVLTAKVEKTGAGNPSRSQRTQCNQQFATVQESASHAADSHYRCELCYDRVPNKDVLSEELKKCYFPTCKELIAHILRGHLKFIRCPADSCGKTFGNRSDFTRDTHIRNHARTPRSRTISKQQFVEAGVRVRGPLWDQATEDFQHRNLALYILHCAIAECKSKRELSAIIQNPQNASLLSDSSASNHHSGRPREPEVIAPSRQKPPVLDLSGLVEPIDASSRSLGDLHDETYSTGVGGLDYQYPLPDQTTLPQYWGMSDVNTSPLSTTSMAFTEPPPAHGTVPQGLLAPANQNYPSITPTLTYEQANTGSPAPSPEDPVALFRRAQGLYGALNSDQKLRALNSVDVNGVFFQDMVNHYHRSAAVECFPELLNVTTPGPGYI